MKAKQGEQFTPGPWTAYEIGAEDGTWNKWSIVHNGPIAYGGDNGKGSENSKATAQLMAAAPELLNALQWFADELPGIIRQSCPQGVPMEVARAHEAARAAIAKARGAV